MKKFILSAAFLAAMFSAKAQTASVNTPTYIGVKCPTCPTNTTTPLLKWDYAKERLTETLTNPDLRGSISIDWAKETITADGTTYKFTRYQISAYEPKVTIEYEGTVLTIYYNAQSQYVGHTIE